MISIIISSYKEKYYLQICKNIEETIGVDYEIIKIENQNQFGICEAYNKGAKKAKGKFLLFLHEDVVFKSKNWGGAVIKSFNENLNLGLLGLAGSTVKSYAPMSWMILLEKYMVTNFIQSSNNLRQDKLNVKDNNVKVVAIDGFFMMVKTEIFVENRFNQEFLEGFHGYDLEYSLTIGEKYDVEVQADIVVEHLSAGSFTKGWFGDVLKINHKWNKQLPKYETKVSRQDIQEIEYYSFRNFMGFVLGNKDIPTKIIYSYIKDPKFFKLVGMRNYIILWFIFIYVVFRKFLIN